MVSSHEAMGYIDLANQKRINTSASYALHMVTETSKIKKQLHVSLVFSHTFCVGPPHIRKNAWFPTGISQGYQGSIKGYQGVSAACFLGFSGYQLAGSFSAYIWKTKVLRGIRSGELGVLKF